MAFRGGGGFSYPPPERPKIKFWGCSLLGFFCASLHQVFFSCLSSITFTFLLNSYEGGLALSEVLDEPWPFSLVYLVSVAPVGPGGLVVTLECYCF